MNCGKVIQVTAPQWLSLLMVHDFVFMQSYWLLLHLWLWPCWPTFRPYCTHNLDLPKARVAFLWKWLHSRPTGIKIGLRSNNRIVEMHNKWLLLTLSVFWHFHIFSEISFIKPDNLELWNELSWTWTHRFGLLTIFCGQKEKHYFKTSSIKQKKLQYNKGDWQPTVINLWTT